MEEADAQSSEIHKGLELILHRIRDKYIKFINNL